MTKKLCKDCKWCRKNGVNRVYEKTDYSALCMRPDNINPVTGEANNYSCSYERIHGYLCGQEAKYWEAK
jgi:hypothetical protein